MSKIRLGIIGAGNFVYKRHIPEILECKKVKLISLCRRDIKQLKKIGAFSGITSLYTNHTEMLKNENLDAVLISSPHSLHAAHAIEALNYGCHVMIEKPIATSVKDAKSIIKVANRNKLKVMPLYNPPFESHFQEMKRLIKNSNFGKLENASISWSDNKSAFFGKSPYPKGYNPIVMPTNFRNSRKLSGGGILFDSGCHIISEVLWLVGKKPISVYADIDDQKSELRAAIILEFENSIFIEINIIGDTSHKERRLESSYYGSKQALKLTGRPYKINVLKKNNKDKIEIEKFKRVDTPIQEFSSYILGLKKKLNFTLADSILVTSIIEASYKSASKGKKYYLT